MSKQYNQRKPKPGNSNDGKKPGAMKKFHPLSSMNKPKFSFETVLTSFLDHLLVLSSTNKNMNDMAESMKAGAMITLVRPTILVSSNTNPDLKAAEDKAYAITMASQLKTFHAREEDLRQNQPFVKSLIMTKFVTQEMEDKLRNEVDFETTLQNPIELINRIEKFMKESYDGSYDVWNHFQQQQKLYSMRQMTTESAINWKKRFERQGEIVKEHAGDAMFRDFITTTKSYKALTDATSKTAMQDKAYEIIMATGLLCNSDRKRTDGLIKELREQFARDNDQYPRTLDSAYNMLNVHIEANSKSQAQHGTGLYQAKKEKKEGKDAGKKTKDRACYVCGKKDCLAPKCPRRWDPKEKWHDQERYKVYPAAAAGTTNVQTGAELQPNEGNQLVTVPSSQGSVGTHQSMMQVPMGTQLMQVETTDGRTMLVPYIAGTGFTQQPTVRLSNVNTGQGGRGSRPFVRGNNFTQSEKLVSQNQQNTKKYKHHVVRQQGNELIMLGTWSQYHHFHYDIDSGEEIQFPDWAAHEFEGQEVGAERYELADEAEEGEQYLHHREEERDTFGLFNKLLLDSGATHTTMCNSEMVHNIVEASMTLDMSSNMGSRLIDEECQVGTYPGYVYFDIDGKANVMSLSEMIEKGYRITMDTDVANAFIVHCNDGKIMRFVESKGVYLWEDPKHPMRADNTSLKARGGQTGGDNTNNNQPVFFYQSGTQMLEASMPTVRSNKEGFTPKQVKAAMEARSAMHIIGAPDERKFKQALRTGLFKDCNITEKAIDHAHAIYGKDTSTLKGKSTRITPKKLVDDWIEIPRELKLHNHKIELCIDHMFVNNAILLTCVDTTITRRGCKAVPNTTKESMFTGVDTFLRLYNKGGFKVTKIHCDNEFIPITNEMMDVMDVQVEATPPGGHEPHSERNNRTIKERMRVAHARMPFKAIPRIMTEQLAETVTEKLNWFPAKNGISEHYSPEQIVDHRNVNFKRDCVSEFGAYVHGSGGESNNKMAPRTVEGVYIRATRNERGGHRILNLNTKKFIIRPKVVVLPATDQVIARVEEWAHEENVHTLKFFDKYGNEETFQDGDQIAGVDDTQQGYAEEAFDPDYEPNEEEDVEYDANLQDRFDNVDEEEEVDLYMDAIDNVYDDNEAEQLFDEQYPHLRQDVRDEDYDVDLESPIESDEENDIPMELQDMEDELEALHDEIMNMQADEPEPAEFPKMKTRSGKEYAQMATGQSATYAQVVMGEHQIPRSEGKIKRNGRSYTRKKQRAKELKVKIKRVIHRKKTSRSNIERHKEAIHNLQFQQIGSENHFDYTDTEAVLIGRCMMQIKDKFRTEKGAQYIQQYYLNKGLKIFGDRGVAGVDKELRQLLQRKCFEPTEVKNLSQQQKDRAQEAMMLLAEKDFTKEVKGRLVYRGDGTREWLSREDTASPTASLEGIELTVTVDAYENRDMMSMDVPNAFIQTFMPEPKLEDGEEEVIMKITGALVNILTDMDPEMRKFVVIENGKRVIYTVVLRAIYGMLQSSLLWYNQFRGDLEERGFVFNEYDPCIANKTVNGKQQTIRFHVDDLLSSHVDPKVNDEFAIWLNDRYGAIKPCTIVRGKKHRYLGMLLDFSYPGKVKIRMDEYVEKMINEFPIKFGEDDKQETPAGNDLLDAGRGSLLDNERRETFHSFVAKGLFVSKRARIDIHPTVSVLATRVRKPNESDWKKLVRLIRYLHSTKGWHKTLRADSLKIIKHYVDASFAVHPDFRSHTGSTMTMGDGAMLVKSSKQKLNSRSSTEAELIGVDDAITMILWTKLFMEAQVYVIEENIIYQDNKSAILLEKNGRKSAGKRSRAINIRYFFVTDHVDKGNVTIEYCPTDEMIADFMTKPLQGQKFRDFRSDILGEQD